MEQAKVRIGNLGAIALIGVALFFDAAQALFTLLTPIPILGIVAIGLGFVASLFGWVALFLAIKLGFDDVQFFGGKEAALKVLSLLACIGIELIPFLQALPAFLCFVLTIIFAARVEDTLGGEKVIRKIAGGREVRVKRVEAQQKQRLEAAEQRDERRGGTKEQYRAAKKNERELREEKRKVSRQNAGIIYRAAVGDTSRRVQPRREQVPGMLQEQEPELVDAPLNELDRYDRAA